MYCFVWMYPETHKGEHKRHGAARAAEQAQPMMPMLAVQVPCGEALR
jgi:hypothetical protein